MCVCFGENLVLQFHFAPGDPACAALSAAGLDERADDRLGEERAAGDCTVVGVAEADRGRVYVNAEYSHDLARVGAGDRLDWTLKLDPGIGRPLLDLARDDGRAADPAADPHVVPAREVAQTIDPAAELGKAVRHHGNARQPAQR